MAEKRNFWIKFKDDFTDNRDMKRLEDMPGGYEYAYTYLKLILKTIKTNGVFSVREGDDLIKELALYLQVNERTVSFIINYGLRYELFELLEFDKSLIVKYTVENLGSETAAAERMRKMREKEKTNNKAIPNTERNIVTGMLQDSYIETEINQEKEKQQQIKTNNEHTAAVIQLMVDAGINKKDAIELIDTYGFKRVEEKTRLLIQRQQKAKEGNCASVRNPGGFVREAARKDYHSINSLKSKPKYDFM